MVALVTSPLIIFFWLTDSVTLCGVGMVERVAEIWKWWLVSDEREGAWLLRNCSGGLTGPLGLVLGKPDIIGSFLLCYRLLLIMGKSKSSQGPASRSCQSLFCYLVIPLVTSVGGESCVLQEVKYWSALSWGTTLTAKMMAQSYRVVQTSLFLHLLVREPEAGCLKISDVSMLPCRFNEKHLCHLVYLAWFFLPQEEIFILVSLSVLSLGLGKSWMGLGSYFQLSSVLLRAKKKINKIK